MTPKLAGSTYGSEEYKAFLGQMKPALDHHYAVNDHHPEHFRWRCGICERRCTDAEWEVARKAGRLGPTVLPGLLLLRDDLRGVPQG